MASAANRDIRRGYGSKERPLTKTLWDRDTKSPSEAMKSAGNFEPDYRSIDYARYYDPALAQKEAENLWSKRWLLAAREEELPSVGDRLPIDIGSFSFMLIRSGPEEFKAFYNACMHRGTRLCEKSESGDRIRCPFHGWEWKLDGRLSRIPSHWDFVELTPANSFLPEARIGRWGGFIFVNNDPDAPSLEAAMGPIPRHFENFGAEKRYTQARFRKQIACNWKVAQEAFMEAYHVPPVHPEGVPIYGDTQTQYDIWADGAAQVARLVTPSAIPSMHAPSDVSVLEAASITAIGIEAWRYPGTPLPKLDESADLRAQIAQWHREAFRQSFGRQIDAPDSHMIDSIQYFMFPNSVFWLSEAFPLVYNFTPHRTDPEQCFFDVRLLVPIAEGQPRPPAAKAVEIGVDELVADKAIGFGGFGNVYDQDADMMARMQRGVRAARSGHSHLGMYQERIIQRWNELLDRDVYGAV